MTSSVIARKQLELSWNSFDTRFYCSDYILYEEWYFCYLNLEKLFCNWYTHFFFIKTSNFWAEVEMFLLNTLKIAASNVLIKRS